MTDMLQSIDPASGEIVWEGAVTWPAECAAVVGRARQALRGWATTGIDQRIAVVRAFAAELQRRADAIAEAISRETGKLLWESRSEVGAMIGKIEVSIAAQRERAGTREDATAFGKAVLRHRPHGVMVVLGPYNFPGHLPNGHIVPALLAGNTIVFKPSELTPWTGELMADAWRAAGLPDGVFNLTQGGRDTGAALIAQDIDGLLFTGSSAAGRHFRHAMLDRPHVILALELGGNNPLIAWDGASDAVAGIAAMSSYITTGQRCSCARRLILPEGREGDRMVEALTGIIDRMRIAAWSESGDAFMGPLVSDGAALRVRSAVAALAASGARAIRALAGLNDRRASFVTPGLYDVTGLDTPDEEIFGPALFVRRVPDFAAALASANATGFGLSAGLISEDDALWEAFLDTVRAGIANRNRPTTGAAATMPFGGPGESGNHRPGAWYAADYCAYPVSSFESRHVLPEKMPGFA